MNPAANSLWASMEFLKTVNRRFLPGRIFSAPEWLVLGVNNACNLHCRMCDVGTAARETNFARNLLGSRPMNMPMELMERVVNQTAEFFPSTRIGFAFTEPLIYPHLVQSVAMAHDKGLHTAVTTNGFTLEPAAEPLARAGLDQLFLSLDGPPEIHDEIRGRQGSFHQAAAGVERLLACQPRPAISVFAVITPWNVGHLVEFVEIFKKWPLESLGFMHPNFTTPEVADAHNARFASTYPATTSNLGPFDPTEVDLDILLSELEDIETREWPFPVSTSPVLTTRPQLERFYLRPQEFIGTSCSDVSRTMMIKSDGSVIPAHGRCYELTVGDLNSQTLPEIWNSSVMVRFRKTLAGEGGLLPACSRCCSAF